MESWGRGAGPRNGRGGRSVWIQRHHRRRQAACLICLCIPSTCRGCGNTSGIGSAERNFGSSLRRISERSDPPSFNNALDELGRDRADLERASTPTRYGSRYAGQAYGQKIGNVVGRDHDAPRCQAKPSEAPKLDTASDSSVAGPTPIRNAPRALRKPGENAHPAIQSTAHGSNERRRGEAGKVSLKRTNPPSASRCSALPVFRATVSRLRFWPSRWRLCAGETPEVGAGASLRVGGQRQWGRCHPGLQT